MNKKLEFLDSLWFKWLKIALSFLLILTVKIFIEEERIKMLISLIGLVLVGYETVIDCVKNVIRGNVLNENTLMLIASVTAFVLGEYFESVIILSLFCLGETLEDIATDSSRKKVESLSKLKQNISHIKIGNTIEEVNPSNIKVGDLLYLKMGESLSIDGVLEDEFGEFDFKTVTGESETCLLKKGDRVYSGAINVFNPVCIRATTLYKDSTVEKIVSLVESATAKKSKSQNFISYFSKIYTPIVVLIAVFIGVVGIFSGEWEFWIYKALSFLVISCPCALVISVPLSFFIGIGTLAKKGVLVKGGNYIDVLSKVKTVVFDKTGTLTVGKLTVEKIIAEEGYDESDVINYACALEKFSSHPIAKAIVSYGKNSSFTAKDIKEIVGKGIEGIVNENDVFVGKSSNLDCPKNDGFIVVTVKMNGVLMGKIFLIDEIKRDALKVVLSLKKLGVKESVVLSGDRKENVERVCETVGIDKACYGLLPEEKTEKLKKYIDGKNKVMFVGDGINDSPCIALSDVGVSMGKIGSDIAIETSDVVIMNDDLNKIPLAIKHSKKTEKIVKENIVFSILVKLLVMVLSLITKLPVWLAVFSDVGVMILTILNSMRLHYIKSI